MHCTMSFPIEIDIFKILKSKNSFLAHFRSKHDYFSSRWCKIVQIIEYLNIWFHIFCQIFVKIVAKNVNLVCRAVRLFLKKNFKIAFFSEQPSWSKYLLNIFYQFFHQTNIWRGHIQLVLKIFITSCLFFWFFFNPKI